MTEQFNQQLVQSTYVEKLLVKQLTQSIKDHLLNAIDRELETICREAALKHIEAGILSETKPTQYGTETNYIFNFVQNIVQTETKPIVMKEIK
jgi:hypothetical protein